MYYFVDSVFSSLLILDGNAKSHISVIFTAIGNTSSTMTSPNMKTGSTCGCVKNFCNDEAPGNNKDKTVQNPALDQHLVNSDSISFKPLTSHLLAPSNIIVS